MKKSSHNNAVSYNARFFLQHDAGGPLSPEEAEAFLASVNEPHWQADPTGGGAVERDLLTVEQFEAFQSKLNHLGIKHSLALWPRIDSEKLESEDWVVFEIDCGPYDLDPVLPAAGPRTVGTGEPFFDHFTIERKLRRDIYRFDDGFLVVSSRALALLADEPGLDIYPVVFQNRNRTKHLEGWHAVRAGIELTSPERYINETDIKGNVIAAHANTPWNSIELAYIPIHQERPSMHHMAVGEWMGTSNPENGVSRNTFISMHLYRRFIDAGLTGPLAPERVCTFSSE